MFADYGTNSFQLSILLAVWSATSFLFEIPSGVLADKYSRKMILVIGQIIRALGYFSWLQMPSSWAPLIGFALWGVGSACISGTLEALIYDELKQKQRERKFTKILGHMHGFEFAAILLVGFIVFYIAQLGYSFILILSILAACIAALFALSLPNAPPVESTHETEYWQLLKKSVQLVLKKRILLHIIILISLSMTLGGALDEYWPVFCRMSGLTENQIGLFFAAMSLLQLVASLAAHRCETWSNSIFYIFFILNGILLATAALWLKPFSVLLLLLFSFLFKIIDVVFESKLHHQIPSETRATVASVKGFSVEVTSIFIYLSFGLVAKLSGNSQAFLFFGFLTSAIGLGYLIVSFFISRKTATSPLPAASKAQG